MKAEWNTKATEPLLTPKDHSILLGQCPSSTVHHEIFCDLFRLVHNFDCEQMFFRLLQLYHSMNFFPLFCKLRLLGSTAKPTWFGEFPNFTVIVLVHQLEE